MEGRDLFLGEDVAFVEVLTLVEGLEAVDGFLDGPRLDAFAGLDVDEPLLLHGLHLISLDGGLHESVAGVDSVFHLVAVDATFLSQLVDIELLTVAETASSAEHAPVAVGELAGALDEVGGGGVAAAEAAAVGDRDLDVVHDATLSSCRKVCTKSFVAFKVPVSPGGEQLVARRTVWVALETRRSPWACGALWAGRSLRSLVPLRSCFATKSLRALTSC